MNCFSNLRENERKFLKTVYEYHFYKALFNTYLHVRYDASQKFFQMEMDTLQLRYSCIHVVNALVTIGFGSDSSQNIQIFIHFENK